MRVFVTGASGHIGSAVVPELLEAGHEVIGLARSESASARLSALGAEAHRGDLDDLDGLRAAATQADGVIHLAFKHDLNDIAAAAVFDQRAVDTIGAALEASKPFVETSGTLLLAALALGRPGTEADTSDLGPRVGAENATVAMADRGVRSSVVRLPPIVHSSLDHHGFTHRLIDTARDTGVSAYVGDGRNRWPSVHTLDAARLYRLALEAAPAGSRLHGVADEGIAFADLAAAIGRGLDLPVASIAPRGGERALRLPRPARLTRCTRIERVHPTTARLGTDASRTHRRPEGRPLPPGMTGV